MAETVTVQLNTDKRCQEYAITYDDLRLAVTRAATPQWLKRQQAAVLKAMLKQGTADEYGLQRRLAERIMTEVSSLGQASRHGTLVVEYFVENYIIEALVDLLEQDAAQRICDRLTADEQMFKRAWGQDMLLLTRTGAENSVSKIGTCDYYNRGIIIQDLSDQWVDDQEYLLAAIKQAEEQYNAQRQRFYYAGAGRNRYSVAAQMPWHAELEQWYVSEIQSKFLEQISAAVPDDLQLRVTSACQIRTMYHSGDVRTDPDVMIFSDAAGVCQLGQGHYAAALAWLSACHSNVFKIGRRYTGYGVDAEWYVGYNPDRGCLINRDTIKWVRQYLPEYYQHLIATLPVVRQQGTAVLPWWWKLRWCEIAEQQRAYADAGLPGRHLTGYTGQYYTKQELDDLEQQYLQQHAEDDEDA